MVAACLSGGRRRGHGQRARLPSGVVLNGAHWALVAAIASFFLLRSSESFECGAGVRARAGAHRLRPQLSPLLATVKKEHSSASKLASQQVSSSGSSGADFAVDGHATKTAAPAGVFNGTASDGPSPSVDFYDSVYSDINDTFSSAISELQERTEQSVKEIEMVVQSTALATSRNSSDAFDELNMVLENMKKEQNRQIKSVYKAASDVERTLARLTGDIAFADTPLSNIQTIPKEFKNLEHSRNKAAASRTLLDNEGKKNLVTRRMRSRKIVENWRAAPLYATAALLARWCNKCLGIPLLPVKAVTSLVQKSGSRTWRRDGAMGQWTGDPSDAAAMRTAEQMQEKWKRSATTGTFRRSVEIWGYALNFVLKEKRLTSKKARGRIGSEEFSRRRTLLAKEVTQILLKLGPTFIKVGQLLSTRIDILPKEYIEQLKLLQDNVPPFSGETSKLIIEQELGAPIEELFDTFNTTSLAAASLGQVHIATKGDKTFAIKVQRQYLRELFEVDLRNLRQLAGFLDAVDPKAEGTLLDANTERDWISVYEESKRLLYEEIDYVNERKNCVRFKENFDLPRFSHIRVPETYPELSTEKVLCMEYAPGVKVTDTETLAKLGLDPIDIGIKSAEAYLEQLCRHGFFHCDPHPGNIAVEADEDGSARLIYYDFGMMDTFTEKTRKGLIDFLFAFYENEPREACNALAVLGILKDDPNIDRIAVERIGKDFMDRFQDTLNKGAKFENELDAKERQRIDRQRRLKLGEEFLTMNSDVPFLFPPTWTFVFRAFMSLDGIGKTLDKNYDMTRIAKPYLKELIDLKDGSALKTVTLKVAKRFGLRPVDLNVAVTQPRRTAFVQDVTRRLEQGDFKLRVRALETERALERSALVQSNIFNAVCCGVLVNCAITLGGLYRRPTAPLVSLSVKFCLASAAFFGIQVPVGIKRVRNLDAYFEKFGRKK